MAADTYTSTLGALLMGTGNDNNSWGSNANSDVFQIFEDAIANVLTSSVTGGTLDLSGTPPPSGPSQVRYAALVFTGTLTSNQILKVPNLTKFWWVNNQTSGAFTLTIQTPSGSASSAIPQNSGWQRVSCDGSNNIVVSPFNDKQVQMPDGTAATPSYSFLNEKNSGWYRHGAGDVRFSVLGTDILQVTGSVVNVLSGTLEQGGVAVATGTAVTASGTPTAGHLASWASATQIQDAGAAGALANLNTVTGKYIDRTVTGYGMPLNYSLSAAVASNVLTVTLNGANGSAPSATNPIWVNFPDTTLANGDPLSVQITSALTIDTHAVGASLGSTSGTPCRFWIVLFYNGGTPVLGLINCSTASQYYTLDEAELANSTAMSSGATSAFTFYTEFGTAVTNSTYRILGYLTYETALVTAGTYNNAPDVVRLFGPGVAKPGEAINTVWAQNITSQTTLGASFTQTTVTASITPRSKANLVEIDASLNVEETSTFSATFTAQISRGTTPTLVGGPSQVDFGTSNAIQWQMAIAALDAPAANTAQSYYVFAKSTDGHNTTNTSGASSWIRLREIMG